MTKAQNGRGTLLHRAGLAGEALRAAAAVAAVALGLGLRQALEAAFGPQPPFITLYPTVMVVALLLGLYPGLLATALSALAVLFWIADPRGSWAVAVGSDAAALAIFSGAGVFLSVMARLHQRARHRAAELEKEAALREAQGKLEAALASTTDAVFISDAAGRFIHFNEAFATFHRFASLEACARTFDEYPDLLDVFLADGTPAPVEQWAVPRALRGE